MRVFESVEDLPELVNPVVTVGSFDGVHLGHLKILEQVRKIARQTGGESVVVTFSPHPRQFFGDADFQMIHPMEKNLSLLAEALVDNVIVLPFTKEFSQRSYAEFLTKDVILSIKAKTIVMGPNHGFGRDRAGNYEKAVEICREYGVSVEQIPEFVMEEVKIHSSEIRRFLKNGEKEQAEKLLGYKL